MPTFKTLPPAEPPPPPGVYVAKIAKALERTSEAGNAMIAMKLALPSGRTLPCTITFVEQARPVVNAFCNSAELLRPTEPDIEVQLNAAHCLNRYVYFKLEHDDEGVPKITRFIDRAAALAANPRLADVKLEPQQPFTLPLVRSPAL